MKALILSFFIVILSYSFFANKKDEVKESIPPTMHENSVYQEVHPALQQQSDSIYLLNEFSTASVK